MTENSLDGEKDEAVSPQTKQQWMQRGDDLTAQKRFDTKDALVYKAKGVALFAPGPFCFLSYPGFSG